ncbi:transcriptional regulator [Streptomyces sp. NPDC000987]|uniref:transcriptional regulator n=1 Tax=Streptomyces sp. NPDC000987 TaxID=3154374 RepID=UPI003332A1B4
MTVVGTTEPPRLPVRQWAEARERGRGGVSPMLTRLAAERATGVLVRERGTLHLAEGLVVDAESPAAPGLDVLLTAHGTLAAGTWRQALAAADGDRLHTARALADSGRLPFGTLEMCHLAALYDAAFFALAPSSAPGRFRYGDAGRPGAVRPVPVEALERETLRRRDLLHRIWPDPRTDDVPLLRTGLAAAPALTRRQRAVLDRVNGVRTATDIARELGRPAFHTLVDVRRLTAAGVVRGPTTGRGTGPATSSATGPAPTTAPARAAGPAPAPGRGPAPGGDPPPDLAGPLPAHLSTDPHITLLKRLRDALEAL